MPARPKVLIIDDEIDVLRSTEMVLDRHGYDCVVLPDGAIAADVAQHVQPNLILLDLIMPGVDTATVVRDLRGRAATQKIPLVLFSASGELGNNAAQYDAAGFLSKPFGEKELVEVLKGALHKKAEPVVAWTVPPKAHATSAADPHDAQRQVVREYFHDYWNTLTALNNYAHFLRSSPRMGPAESEASGEIERLVLELEAKTDALRTQLLQFVG